MRAARIVRDFLEWRWAPCVALTAGSLAYVGLALLLIPNELGSGSSSADGTAIFARPTQLPNTAFASSLARSPFESTPSTHEAAPHPTAPPRAPEAPVRRGFSPPIEQPEAPPPPPPPPPPPVVQAPVVQPPPGVPGMQAPSTQAAPVPTTQPAVPPPAPPPAPEPTSAATPPPPATPGVFEEGQPPPRPAP
jgi:hypothetical protein